MTDTATVLQAVLPVFALAGAGLLLRRVGWLTPEADASLLRLTVNVLLPCLIFDRLLGNEALGSASNLVLAPLVGLGLVGLGLVVTGLLAGTAGLTAPAARRTFVFATALFNYGYLPIPLIASLYRDQPALARDTTAVLLVHNVGVEIALWTFGLVVLAGTSLRQTWRQVLNAPVIAIVLSVALNLVVDRAQVPAPLLTTAHLLAECAIPLGILVVGATMADHARGFAAGEGRRTMVAACLLRFGILPPLVLLAAWLVPGSPELRRVIVIQAAMPAAVFPIVLARHYGGDAGTALRVVIATSVVGLVATPLWLGVGFRLLSP